MLYQFTFKNFKSYKNETVFDMQAENIDEFSESLIESGSGKKVLPTSVIYGPNGGGKSSVLEALVCIISIIVNPIILLKQRNTIFDKTEFAFYSKCEPYKFDKVSKNEPTEFEIFFATQEAEYRYIIYLLQDKVLQEHLYKRDYNSKKPTKIYNRNVDGIQLGEILKKEKLGTSVNENMPYLCYLAIKNNIEIVKDIIQWFQNVIAINYANSQSLDIEKIKNENTKKILLILLKSMGVDIQDYRIEEKEDKIELYTKHKNVNGEFELNLNEESQGTRKLFNVIPHIIDSIVFGGLTVIDELDAKLHPKLLKSIIGIYKDKEINSKGGQLIFSSHDLTTMNNEIFRRDEIWFACKDEEEISEIYSLYEIRDEKGEHIRAKTNFHKQYIEGRYGADPYLTTILNWEVK